MGRNRANHGTGCARPAGCGADPKRGAAGDGQDRRRIGRHTGLEHVADLELVDLNRGQPGRGQLNSHRNRDAKDAAANRRRAGKRFARRSLLDVGKRGEDRRDCLLRVAERDGKIVIAEPMSGGQTPDRSADAYFALYCMAMGTGTVRSVAQIGELLSKAGFARVSPVKTGRPFVTRIVTAEKTVNKS